jgi:ferrous iron transport protein B
MHGSLAAFAGRALEPISRPAGFDWRLNVGLIGSVGARELMVGTLGVIFGIEGNDDLEPLSAHLRDARTATGALAYGVPTALSLMAFFVIACQCMSTVAAVKRETRSWRWPLFVLGYTYAVAWVLAVLVFQGATLLGLS